MALAIAGTVGYAAAGAQGSIPEQDVAPNIAIVWTLLTPIAVALFVPDVVRAVRRRNPARPAGSRLGDDTDAVAFQPVQLPLVVTLQPRWARWAGAVLGIGLGSALVVTSVVPQLSPGASTASVLGSVAMGVGGVALGWRWLRCTLAVSDEQVLVRNPFRSRRLDWGDISGFHDGTFSDEGGHQWILVIRDRRNRRIKPLATVGQPHPAQLASWLTQAAGRHGVTASLTPFPKTTTRPPRAGAG